MGTAQTARIPALSVDGEVIVDDQAKAEAFNATYLESSNLDDSDKQLPPFQNLDHPIMDEIHVSPEEVDDILSILDTSKAYGPDEVSPKLLKEARPCITSSLARLFNLSLSSACFPDFIKS